MPRKRTTPRHSRLQDRCIDVESRDCTITNQAIQFAVSANMIGMTEDAHLSV
ncbi:hypothetical protein N9549_03110 [Acidimicrobiales bacterium]|nr:hypothetical protein [Acidimicrobiales bacterium]MDB4818267.1 hypothetical protein [Acidimicrobiales bacterium]